MDIQTISRAVTPAQAGVQKKIKTGPQLALGLQPPLYISLYLLLFFIAPAHAADKPKGPLKISADGALEFHRDDHQFIARGNVIITQDDMTLMADHVVADYHDKTSKGSDAQSNGIDIYRLTATGKTVTLKTATETATGTRAVYDKSTNLVTLDGPVTITRDKNILRGSRATLNLTTQQSTLLGDPKSGGRVTGVFYTEEVKGK